VTTLSITANAGRMSPKRRSKGDGGLFQRSDGMWIGRVELPPGPDLKRRRKTVSSMSFAEAAKKLKKLRADVDEGRIAATGSTTVAKWLERWLEEIHGPRVRPTTKRDYATTIRLYINPHIGDKKLDKLTPAHVRQMNDAIASDRSAQKAHVVLQRALRDAVREGMIVRNVAEVADKPRYVSVQREPLTSEQAKQLLRVSERLRDPLRSRWGAALLLGARQGELLGLQWSHVNLDAGLVDLEWQLQQLQQVHGCGNRHSDKSWPCGRTRPGWCPDRKWDLPRGFQHKVLHRSLVLTRPKTKAGTRLVPTPAPLWALLEQHPRGDTNPHNLVWHHDDGRPFSPRDDHRNWKQALKAADLPEAPLHVARNTTATLLMEAGVPEHIRMEILGHVSIAAHRGYAYVDKSLARQAMTALDQLLA
jgi:integrase